MVCCQSACYSFLPIFIALILSEPCLAVPADLDPTFNNGNVLPLDDVGYYLEPSYHLILQSDGKILVAGQNGSRIGILRLLQGGQLDRDFSTDGRTRSYYDGSLAGIALQSDGKIVVGGKVSKDGVEGLGGYRFLSNGEEDLAYGHLGQAINPQTDGMTASSMLLRKDQSLIVAGTTSGSTYRYGGLCRFATDGQADPTFNDSQGYSLTPLRYEQVAYQMLNRQDGGVLLATSPSAYLHGFLPDGRLDLDYEAVAFTTGQISGGLLADAGDEKVWCVAMNKQSSYNQTIGLTRLLPNGQPDESFNGGEPVWLTAAGTYNEVHDIAVQHNGKVLLAVSTGNTYVATQGAILRVNVDGSLDESFNGTGKLVLENQSHLDAVAVQKDGKILVAGWGGLLRLMGDPTVPEIVLEQPVGSVLESGTSTGAFAPSLPNEHSVLNFIVKNLGGNDLTLEGITFSGPDAADFEVSIAPQLSTVLLGGQESFSIRFHPSVAGSKQTVMHVASNAANTPDFTVNLSGLCLAPQEDYDQDGVTNEAEIRMAALGFDPMVDSSSLRGLLHENAAGAGLLNEAALETLALKTVLLPKDSESGRFKLRLFLERSLDLSTWVPVAGLNPQIDAENGRIDVEIEPASQTSAFFKVLGAKP